MTTLSNSNVVMDPLYIEGSEKIPTIDLDAEKGELTFRGRSIPENSREFYAPVLDWIDHYSLNPLPKTRFIIGLDYFNTSSSKCLLDVLRRAENLKNMGQTEVLVEWQYEEDDEDMLEAGKDYSAMVTLPFELIEVPDYHKTE